MRSARVFSSRVHFVLLQHRRKSTAWWRMVPFNALFSRSNTKSYLTQPWSRKALGSTGKPWKLKAPETYHSLIQNQSSCSVTSISCMGTDSTHVKGVKPPNRLSSCCWETLWSHFHNIWKVSNGLNKLHTLPSAAQWTNSNTKGKRCNWLSAQCCLWFRKQMVDWKPSHLGSYRNETLITAGLLCILQICTLYNKKTYIQTGVKWNIWWTEQKRCVYLGVDIKISVWVHLCAHFEQSIVRLTHKDPVWLLYQFPKLLITIYYNIIL